MSAMILGESMCSEYFCRMSKRDGSLIKQRSWSSAITLLRNHPLTVIGSGKSLTSWLQFCFLIISLEKRAKNKSWETLPAKRDLISCESGAGFVCKWLLQLKGERRHQFRQLAEQKISAFHFDSIAWMWAGELGRETRDKLLAGKCECQQCLWVNGAGKKTIFCQSRATRREERGSLQHYQHICGIGRTTATITTTTTTTTTGAMVITRPKLAAPPSQMLCCGFRPSGQADRAKKKLKKN